jgi:hypothetical protein
VKIHHKKMLWKKNVKQIITIVEKEHKNWTTCKRSCNMWKEWCKQSIQSDHSLKSWIHEDDNVDIVKVKVLLIIIIFIDN